MRLVTFVFIGLLCVNPVRAGPPGVPEAYSIPWFELSENTQERNYTIRRCRDDYRLYENERTRPLCNNAEAAATRLWSKRLKLGMDSVNTVDWWIDQRDIRKSTLSACARGGPDNATAMQYCDLAREAERKVNQNNPPINRSRIRS